MRTGRRPRMKDSLRPQVRFFCCAPTNASRVFTQPGSNSALGRCPFNVRITAAEPDLRTSSPLVPEVPSCRPSTFIQIPRRCGNPSSGCVNYFTHGLGSVPDANMWSTATVLTRTDQTGANLAAARENDNDDLVRIRTPGQATLRSA